ncbi:hypothetical protein ACHAWF_006791 [Thalassiosira exigua]
MAPRRSGRRNLSPYKKGDYVEYQYKGSTVTGQLLKRGPKGSGAWIVIPSDRRRKNEEIPENALGNVIDAQEAMNNRGPKLKKNGRELSQSSSNSNSDGSLDDPQAHKRKSGSGSGRGSSGEETSGSKKRKDVNGNGGSGRAAKSRKTVTFSQESNAASANSRKVAKKSKAAKAASTRIGTRSTRGSGEAVLLPELPARKKKLFKTKKIKKDDNVTVVKMLTGTLYLYRGDRPRAEFIRTK